MTEEDIFFTHTIVGPALSLPLGDIPAKTARPTDGLQANMLNSRIAFSQAWKDWILLQGTYPYVGVPRRRPGTLRRWLERYALLIALLGLLMALGAVVYVWMHTGTGQ